MLKDLKAKEHKWNSQFLLLLWKPLNDTPVQITNCGISTKHIYAGDKGEKESSEKVR